MRIASTDLQTGQIIKCYDSLREAGRDGYTLSRLHKVIHGQQAKSHRGVGWRRIDGLHGLDLWLAERLKLNSNAQVSWWKVFEAFKASLHGVEANVSENDFDAAMVKQGWLPRRQSSILDGAELIPIYPRG
jgi:hypothetical protein